jgi:hypothetical protein
MKERLLHVLNDILLPLLVVLSIEFLLLGLLAMIWGYLTTSLVFLGLTAITAAVLTAAERYLKKHLRDRGGHSYDD